MKLSAADIERIRAEHPIPALVARWGVKLRRQRQGEFPFSGPCPFHSPDLGAVDSTSFACSEVAWVCAGPCQDGGDVFAAVARKENLDAKRDFRACVDYLTGGAAPMVLSAEETAAIAAAAAERAAEQTAEQNEYRDRERTRAYDLYYGREDARADFKPVLLRHPRAAPARHYLRDRRGVDFPHDVLLRFDPRLRLYVPDRPKPRVVHEGPALLAKIQRGGRFQGVHITWFDLDQPKGRLRIVDAKSGQELPRKKMRGSKKGGHIALTPCTNPRELILGEGIEKVLAVWSAMHEGGRDLSRVAFWSAMDLGNLGGKHAELVPHPSLKTETGRVRRVPGPMPDMDAPAIEIPATVERVVLLGDSTSDPFGTALVLARAAERFRRLRQAAIAGGAAAAPLHVVAAMAPAGVDFDDVLRAAASDAVRAEDSEVVLT